MQILGGRLHHICDGRDDMRDACKFLLQDGLRTCSGSVDYDLLKT